MLTGGTRPRLGSAVWGGFDFADRCQSRAFGTSLSQNQKAGQRLSRIPVTFLKPHQSAPRTVVRLRIQARQFEYAEENLEGDDDFPLVVPFDISHPPSIFRGSEQSGLEQLVGRVVA
jgi:hypothetical protein